MTKIKMMLYFLDMRLIWFYCRLTTVINKQYKEKCMNLKNRVAKTSSIIVLLLVCSLVGQSVVYSYGSSSTRTDRWVKKQMITKATPEQVVVARVVTLFYQPLRYGVVSGDVVRMQDFLREEGYFMYPVSTGYYGPLTQAAVAAFQKRNNLDQNGMIDDSTRALVNHYLQKRISDVAVDPVRKQQFAHVLGSATLALEQAQAVHDNATLSGVVDVDSQSTVQKLFELVSGLFGLLR